MTEWKTYKIGDLCKISSSKRIFAKEYKDSGIPFYRGKEIIEKQKGNKISTELYISQERYDEIKAKHGVPQMGDMLLTSVGTLGIPYIVQDEVFYFKDGNLTWFYNFEGLDSRYLYYWFLSPIGKMNIDSKAIGSTQKALTIETLSKFEISLPSLEEQRRIAGILGAIDDKIENNRRINDNLEQQAQALYKQWFVDNRNDDWEEIKLGDIIEISKKSITPAQSENTIFEHYSLPAFDDGIQPVFEKGKYIKSSNFIVKQNIFLFSKLNPRIKRIWLPDIQTENAICSTEFIPYKPKDIAMFGFCYSIVNSDSFYEYVLSLTNGSTGSHQRFHPIDTLDYELMIPNNDYIAKFEELVMPIYRTIARNRMECKNLAALCDTLLPKLMSGEIKVAE